MNGWMDEWVNEWVDGWVEATLIGKKIPLVIKNNINSYLLISGFVFGPCLSRLLLVTGDLTLPSGDYLTVVNISVHLVYIYIYFAVFVTFFYVDFFYYFVSVEENKDKYTKIWNYVVPGIHYFFVVQLPGEDTKRLFNCTGRKTYRDKKTNKKKNHQPEDVMSL